MKGKKGRVKKAKANQQPRSISRSNIKSTRQNTSMNQRFNSASSQRSFPLNLEVGMFGHQSIPKNIQDRDKVLSDLKSSSNRLLSAARSNNKTSMAPSTRERSFNKGSFNKGSFNKGGRQVMKRSATPSPNSNPLAKNQYLSGQYLSGQNLSGQYLQGNGQMTFHHSQQNLQNTLRSRDNLYK